MSAIQRDKSWVYLGALSADRIAQDTKDSPPRWSGSGIILARHLARWLNAGWSYLNLKITRINDLKMTRMNGQVFCCWLIVKEQ
jgi:hypothetical protein